MGYTTTGRATYAVGGNPESARLSGINVGKTKIFAFIAVQILAVISGFMTSGQVMSGTYSFGKGWELDVISMVIVGGTSFTGGVGHSLGNTAGRYFYRRDRERDDPAELRYLHPEVSCGRWSCSWPC